MNTKKVVYEKLFKADNVELAKHQVELGALQDLQSDIVRIEKAVLNIQSERKAFQDKIAKMALDASGNAGSNYSKVKDQSMKLGINPDTLPELKKYQEVSKKLHDAEMIARFGK
jgi:hypothetical protein